MKEPLPTNSQVAPGGSSSIQGIADRLVRDEPAFLSSLDFGPYVRQGIGNGKALFIGDQVEIALFTPETFGRLDYRLALLAKPGDIVVVRKRMRDFEHYLEKCVGIHSITYLEADGVHPAPVALQCRTNPRLREPIAAALGSSGSLTIHAYLTNGHTWRLAESLGSSERRVVHVAGPGPRTARRVNDKLWFWALAREVAGRASVPPTFIAFGPAAAASQVARLAEASEQVVVKVPDSAGAAGNIRIDGKRLRGMRLSRIRDILLRRLAAVGWTGTYPVLVGVWESGVLSSPSAQMWLPQVGEGPPRLLGIFEQRIEAGEGHFVGATRAHFDRDVETAIAEEATRIGAVLQRLGYYGACSLDAVLRLAKSGRRELHWIECNGRWGGVSIPLAAGREILGGTDPKGIVIVQDILPASTAMDIETISNLLSDLLFRRGVTQDGIVILSPPQSTNGVLLNAMALSHSQARAGELMSLAHKRLGRGP